jgi:AcrR family transcriptional regulator
MPGPPGRDRLLDAAERLFAEQGIDATSARAINAAADLSPAALHYHFGNKEKLVAEVLFRRLDALNERRSAMLTSASAQLRQIDGYALSELLVLPLAEFALEKGVSGQWYIRFLSRLYNEKAATMVGLIEANFAQGVRLFDEMVQASARHLDIAEARRRRVLAGETATHGVAHLAEMVYERPNGGELVAPMIRSLVAFIAGGLTSPLPSGAVRG